MTRRVAIIGAAHRFPAADGESFWESLKNGTDLVTEVDRQRWDHEIYQHPNRQHPGTSVTFAAGSLGEGVGEFDATFFGISPREAAHMDPQQRMLLELAWEATEHAGIPASNMRGSRCGVYIGISSLDYAYRHADDLEALDSPSATGNTSSIAANRISYIFDLKGPSMAVDTACSSSLVAFHQACQAIRAGECDTALAGGVSLHLHPFGFIVFTKASMLSANGRCRVFDESGDGYVRSEGAGLFLLKDYDQALADGDRILAVVAGTAVNTDGHKTGLTVPNPDAQIALMRQAYADAGIDIEDIDYLEAHGTGTAVGDPIETHAIGHALGMARSRPLPIGSVKSNIGHLETASGVAGLAKALYSLMHREVPATIGIRKLNPHIKQDEWNLDIVTEARPLPAEGTLTIGVNSFGFGGANAHVILQSPQETQPTAAPRHSAETHCASAPSTAAVAERRLPLRISAQCDNGLREQARRLADLLEHGSDDLYDIAHALETQRAQLKHGAVIITDDRSQACSALRAFAKREDSRNEVITLQRQSDAQGPVFVYSGNGCQWETMGRALLDHCPVFRATIDQVDELFRPQGSFSIREELEGLNGSERFERTEIAQPALFALQVGLTASLRHWGITPSAVVGHSVGEVAAAWACGALSLKDAVTVITQRSHFQGLTKGKGVMTAAVMDAESARTWLNDPRFEDIALAGDNSVRGVTLAGPKASMEALEECLVEQQIACFRLPLDYAFHSSAMAPIEQDVISALAGISPRVSEIPFYSTVSGDIFDTSALDANYWWLNIRQPVRFTEALCQLFDAKANVFVEIGAHPVLKRYLQDAQKDSGHVCTIISSLQRDGDSVRDLQKCLGQLWLSGIAPNTHKVFPVTGRFVELPHYPWQRQQHWMPGTGHKWGLIDRHLEHPLLGYRQSLFDGIDTCWQSQLDVERLPWLADHSVGNAPIFPGAGYVEMSLAAAIHHREAQTIELESLEILAPMMLDSPHGRRSRLRLDRHQGHIHIESRDTQEAGDWQLNAKARVLSDSLGTLLEREAPTLPQRQPDVSLQQHLAMASRVGLDYGPAFQALEGIWREGDTIIGQFGETSRPEEALQHLSPGRLDSAFQLFLPLLADSEAAASGFAFVPVRIDRLQMRTDAGLPVLATATLRKRAPHSFTADFSLFDASGMCVAHLDATRFRLVRLKQTESTSLSFVANVLTPAPHPHTPATMAWDAVEDSLGRLGDSVALATRSRYAEELSPLLDRLSEAFADQALIALGHAERLEKADLEHYHAQYPGTVQQWHHLLTQLEDAGILVSDDNGWTRQSNDEEPSSQQHPQIRPEAIWQMMIGEYPDALPLIQRVGRHGLNLLGLLQGTIEADSLDLTPEHLAALAPHALSTQGWTCLGEQLCAALQEHIAGLPIEQRLSIVEAGIAVPRLGEWFSGLLDADRVDLALLPSDDDGLHHASRLKERHPLIEVASLSDDTAPSAQGQFAILSLSPESRETVDQQLSQLSRHLKPDARLLVLYTPPSHWWDSLCASPGLDSLHGKSCEAEDLQGLLEQWSSAPIQRVSLEQADQGMQLYCIRFSPSAIAQEGLPSQEERLSQDELLSQEKPSAHGENVSDEAPGTRDAHYLLIGNSDHAALAQSLKTALQTNGLSATCCDPDALAREALSLDEIAPEASSLHLIDLRSLSRASDETEQCTWLATWVKLLEGLERPHRLWIMTQGVAALLQVHKPLIDAASSMPLAAASWGFARSMANEISHSHVTLVDTPPCSDGKWSSALLQAMSNELGHPDNETELAYDAEGRRYAVRLRVMPQPSPVQVPADALDDPADAFDDAQGKHMTSTAETQQLTVTLPGQLRHLAWRARPLPDVGADDVQVQVRATGLNFRDVMYTLGLLSDEAIENGFAGATLGLEFSGVVERVGTNITDLSPGDSVVGFGPNSFSERLVASRSALTVLPAGIDFAAAATIPTTFFTVYYALKHLAQVEPGERVLIHGGAGGVGLAAIQIARWLGAELYVTVGSEEKADFLRLYGVERIYHSRQLTYAEEILRDTQGKGVDVVLNSLAGEAIAQNFRALAPFGRFLELGKRDFYENTPVGLRPFRNNLSYFGIDSDQLMKEKPALTARLFREMMALFEDGTLHPLPYTAFDHHRVIEAFRYMQQARQIGKLVVTRESQPNLVEERARREDETPTPRTTAFALDRQASYLVTGGLSGFGLSTAEWLARHGAGHLILLSRRGPASEEAQQGIERLRALDVEVTALACDITDREALAAVIADCGTTLPPLKGIVHAATVIDDGLIRHLDRERIERVLAPKILGARNLHELTQHQPLDLFVLYSSATTLFGNPGQANYVAANCWLEGLAAYRRQQGLAATCVYWGAIEDVGFLARNTRTLEALQERLGGSALQSAAALDTLGQLLATQQSHVGVLELDWHALARFLPTDQAPRFHELSAAAGDSSEHHDNGSELLEQLQCMTAKEMHSTLVSVLRNELATILLIDPEQIDSQQSVYELGFDSLMGVELMTAIEARLNIQLPVMVMSEATSLDKLAQVLVRKLTQGESEEEDGTRSALALANAHGSEEAVALITEEPAQ